MTKQPAAPIGLADGRFAVPANRWDLLDSHPGSRPRVAVVVPFYEQHAQLAMLMAALELQTYPRELLEVVIADDGSADAPQPHTELDVVVVRQRRKGFRAAAARNLGAGSTTASILCFLDADTYPEPDYVRRIVRLPSVLPDALVVGRRRHATFEGWTPDRLREWWSGGPPPLELDEPTWLLDAYGRSRQLLDIDHRSYRYLISSVMCCSRDLFDDIGGFDETFTHYGGEDWELAHRAVSSGAVLQHEPLAVAWHSGPDWAARDIADRPAEKNHEALAIARSVTDPDARRHGLRYEIPDVAVEIDTTSHTVGTLVSTISCFLHLDVGVWLTGPSAAELRRALRDDDPRIAVGSPPRHVRLRCRFVITTHGRPVLGRAEVDRIVETCGEPGVGEVFVERGETGVICRSSWALNRTRRWTTDPLHAADPAQLHGLYETRAIPPDELHLEQNGPNASLAW